METTMRGARMGWRSEETSMLRQEIQKAAQCGRPLRGVFEDMGTRLGRKPNSVRNYYYMQMRAENDEGIKCAAPFVTFTEEEIHALVYQVLEARGMGESVRACVMRLSCGDKALMLRYQNKYRAVLKKRPELIKEVLEELQSEGKPIFDPLEAPEKRAIDLYEGVQKKAKDLEDAEILKLLSGLDALLTRLGEKEEKNDRDRLRVRYDELLIQYEDLQSAVSSMLQCCKEFIGMKQENQNVSDFTNRLYDEISRVENVMAR